MDRFPELSFYYLRDTEFRIIGSALTKLIETTQDSKLRNKRPSYSNLKLFYLMEFSLISTLRTFVYLAGSIY
jgi:hypothetical protein